MRCMDFGFSGGIGMANKKPHPVRAMLLANFDEWIHQPRTVLMFFFMLATTYITVYSYCNGIRTFQYEMHMGESLVYPKSRNCR